MGGGGEEDGANSQLAQGRKSPVRIVESSVNVQRTLLLQYLAANSLLLLLFPPFSIFQGSIHCTHDLLSQASLLGQPPAAELLPKQDPALRGQRVPLRRAEGPPTTEDPEWKKLREPGPCESFPGALE